jgi:hypothetical protein
MTGRDLIIYIMTHGLEDEPLYKDGNILGFMNELEAAVKFNVSTATIHTWVKLGMLDGVEIGKVLYIPIKASSPLETNGGKNV